METQTEPYTFGPTAPSGISTSEEDEYMRLRQAAEEYEDQEEEEDARDDAFSSSGLEGLNQFDGLSSNVGSAYMTQTHQGLRVMMVEMIMIEIVRIIEDQPPHQEMI